MSTRGPAQRTPSAGQTVAPPANLGYRARLRWERDLARLEARQWRRLAALALRAPQTRSD